MRKRSILCLFYLANLAAALVGAGAAESMVRSLSAGGDIAAALAEAAPGDTIRIAAGEYHGNLVIEVPVTLIGEGMPVIRGGYEGNVVDVLAAGTVIEGIEVSESGPHLTKDMACILVQADSVVIRNCRVTEPLHGIYVKGGSHTVLTGNRIEGRLDLQEADRGNGIHLWNSSGNVLSDNEIVDVRDGIYFSFADITDVRDNYIHHVRYGLHYMYSNHNRFSDNLFEKNVAGAALMYSEDIEFERNVFARCRGFRAYGILFQSMKAITARLNLVIDNSRGVFMNNATGSRIENNDIIDNDLAIQLNGGCDDNIFVRNNFINNLSELLLDVSDRETEWADGEGGNHWSRYAGYDLDRDGVGDVPFDIQNVFQVMEGRVPEVRFYLFSPAAKVLEVAERTLPILHLGDARDPKPMMRAAPNEGVPWKTLETLESESSTLWAVLFTAISVASFVGLGFVRVLRMGER